MMDERNPFSTEDEFVSGIFQNITVQGAELRGKVFEDCGFMGCSLADATLADCKFVDCTFTRCNLSNMKLGRSRFAGTEFVECKVLGMDWSRATWPRVAVGAPLRFRQCILNDSTFFGLALEELVIEDCKAHGVDFREADLGRGNFQRTDFANAMFGKTNLTEADFTGATNYSIDVFGNRIDRARFTRGDALALLDSLGIELVD